jgi:large subunit ribosomal protein L13
MAAPWPKLNLYNMKYTLDAQNKKIGRVASEAAKLLMGKNSEEYARNIVPIVEVEIINTSKADINPKKMEQELKASYSGLPSGIKVPTVGHIISKRGYSEIFRKAVYGMLPGNKLRPKMMKHLSITE